MLLRHISGKEFVFSFHGPQKTFIDRFYRKNRDPVRDPNRIAIDPDLFLIAIAVSKSGSDWEMKIADRF
jgi:hypothetical protein